VAILPPGRGHGERGERDSERNTKGNTVHDLLETLKITGLIVGPAVPMLALLFIPGKR
jgi:hypothetical protein